MLMLMLMLMLRMVEEDGMQVRGERFPFRILHRRRGGGLDRETYRSNSSLDDFHLDLVL